jgi:glycosyltransferase involved in cell wall biosynthesis
MSKPRREAYPFVLGIPTYNRYDLLDQCIESAISGSAVPKKIVVIDNGGKYITKRKKVEVVRTCRNLGVGASWNLLHKLTDPLDLVICNDDVRLGRDLLRKLLDCGAPVTTAGGWACFRQRQDVWRIVGPYDEEFFAYHEDNDYSYRLKLAGIERIELGEKDFVHHRSATMATMSGEERSEFNYKWEQGRHYYQRKWGGLPDAERFLTPFNASAEKPKTLEAARNAAYTRACATPSDINEHLPTLREMARTCTHVTEFGRGHGNSTIAFICAAPKTFISYDINPLQEDKMLDMLRGQSDVRLLKGDTVAIDIEPTELLFIDTHHTYEQMKIELLRHGEKAAKYIVFHDTTTFGINGYDGKQGILPAIKEWLVNNPFHIERELHNNNGLLILKRNDV